VVPSFEGGTHGKKEVTLVITVARLKNQTARELAALARREGIAGWHAMRKEELIKALLRSAKDSGGKQGIDRRNGNGAKQAGGDQTRGTNGRFASPPTAGSQPNEGQLRKIRAKLARLKDLAHRSIEGAQDCPKDRLIVLVRDPYWLHAYWELTPQSIDRAQAALGQHWHGARPVLRLSQIAQDTGSAAVRTAVRDIEIHGGVNNWYIDVTEPPKRFQVEIGYLAISGRFLALARSNVVSTALKKTNGLDGNWAGIAEAPERVYAMSGGYNAVGNDSELRDVFEQKLRRPISALRVPRFGGSADDPHCEAAGLTLEVDAELMLFGVTVPGARLTVKGQPIPVQDDGTFTARFPMPNRRQVLPLVVDSGDGAEQRMVVVAIERNTKTMEPVARDADE
jgi:uncharacterized protein